MISLKDDKRVAFGTSFKTVDIWNVKDPELLFSLQGHTEAVMSLALLGGGKFLASGARDQKIKIWNLLKETLVRNLTGHLGIVFTLAQLNDKYLASGAEDSTIRLWNYQTGKLLQTVTSHKDWVYALVKLDNGYLVSGSADLTIKLWAIENDQTDKIRLVEKKTLRGHTGYVRGLIALKKGQLMASYSDDGTIKLWNSTSGLLSKTLTGHNAPVTGLIELSNGNLVSSGRDQKLRIWKASSGKLLKTIPDYTDSLLALSNNNFASSSRGKIHIWNLVAIQEKMMMNIFKNLKN
jgi:WD40 repeat protein